MARQPKRASKINQCLPPAFYGQEHRKPKPRISKRYMFSPPARKCTTQVRYTGMKSCRSIRFPTVPAKARQHRQENTKINHQTLAMRPPPQFHDQGCAVGMKHFSKRLIPALSPSVGQHTLCRHVLPPENEGQKPVGRSRGIDFMCAGDSRIGERNWGSVVEIKALGCSWTVSYTHLTLPTKA